MPYYLGDEGVKPPKLDCEKVPAALINFIELAEKFGISDDGYRDEVIFGLDRNELADFLKEFQSMAWIELENWLAGPEAESKNPTPEYIAFSCLTMAYDMARVRLRNLNDAVEPI